MNKVVGFEATEEIGIGIPNPRACGMFTGPPELIEKLANYLEWVEHIEELEQSLDDIEAKTNG